MKDSLEFRSRRVLQCLLERAFHTTTPFVDGTALVRGLQKFSLRSLSEKSPEYVKLPLIFSSIYRKISLFGWMMGPVALGCPYNIVYSQRVFSIKFQSIGFEISHDDCLVPIVDAKDEETSLAARVLLQMAIELKGYDHVSHFVAYTGPLEPYYLFERDADIVDRIEYPERSFESVTREAFFAYYILKKYGCIHENVNLPEELDKHENEWTDDDHILVTLGLLLPTPCHLSFLLQP
jgi:hypothetical protein